MTVGCIILHESLENPRSSEYLCSSSSEAEILPEDQCHHLIHQAELVLKMTAKPWLMDHCLNPDVAVAEYDGWFHQMLHEIWIG